MKMLICGCMVFLSASVLWADDPESGFFGAFMTPKTPTTPAEPVKPDDKNGKILKDAKVEASALALPSQAELLAGQDDESSLKNKSDTTILDSANAPDPAREELRRQETVEDLQKYPVVSGQGPNEDESTNEAALDLKLLNPNPEGASALRMAEPTAAAG